MLLLLLPSLLPIFHEETKVQDISSIVALIMLIVYLASLVFSFVTHKELFVSHSTEKPKLSKGVAILFLLLVSTALVIVSENFVAVLEEFSKIMNLNDLFVGVVIVGLAGNIAEHLFVGKLALKNKLDLVLSSSIGSALQVSLFVTPILVFTSLFLNKGMTLLFTPLEIVSVISSVLLINEISKDSQVNWFEGLLLVLLYVVIGTIFYFANP